MDGMLGYIRWKPQCKLRSLLHTMAGAGSKEKHPWCLYLKSDLTDARKTHTKSTDATQGSKQDYLGKQKWLAMLAPGRPVLTVSEPSDTVRGHPNVFVFVLLRLLPLLPEPIVVLSKLHHLLHLLADVDPLVFAILICAGDAGQRARMDEGRKKGK